MFLAVPLALVAILALCEVETVPSVLPPGGIYQPTETDLTCQVDGKVLPFPGAGARNI